jgi:hypothetical protein
LERAEERRALTNAVARFTLMASMVESEFGNLSAPGTGNELTGTSLSLFKSSTPRL